MRSDLQDKQTLRGEKMKNKFYQSGNMNVEKLANDLVNAFRLQNYQVQELGTKDQMIVQLKKGGAFVALLGMQVALTVTLNREPGGVFASVGQQQWLDKAAVAAVSMVVLWPLAVTAGAGAAQQVKLVSQVWRTLDSFARQQDSNVHISERAS